MAMMGIYLPETPSGWVTKPVKMDKSPIAAARIRRGRVGDTCPAFM